jgi:hypothetical protein
MIAIGKTINFHILQNVLKCIVFEHMQSKEAKSAKMTPKMFFNNISMGVSKNAEFSANSKFVEMGFLHFFPLFFPISFFGTFFKVHFKEYGILRF